MDADPVRQPAGPVRNNLPHLMREIRAQRQAAQGQRNHQREQHRHQHCRPARLPVRPGLLHLVDRIQRVLNRGKPDRSRPDSRHQTKRNLPRARVRRRLIERVQHHLERVMRHDNRQIIQQAEIDIRGRTSDQSQNRRSRDQRREQGKKKVKAKFRGSRKQVIFHERVGRALRDCQEWSALQIPQRVKRRVGHGIPDPLPSRITMRQAAVSPVGRGSSGAFRRICGSRADRL